MEKTITRQPIIGKVQKKLFFIEKRKVLSKLVLPLLLLVGLNQSLNAQCNAVAPYICITTNPASSGITTTTVDISAASAQSYWQWLDRVGVVWSTSPNPTITTNMGIQQVTLPASSTLTGTMPAFTITGLTPGTTYYLRAFGTYSYPSEAATYYNTQITFTTTSAGPITMTTNAASAITATSATSGGTATITGGVTIVERGVVYNTATNPTTANTKVISGAGAGAFVSNLTGLTSSTTYYVRSYSIDNNGITYYGPNISFTTSFQVSGIISPFSLSPTWYFGSGARYTFPSGSYPAVPPGPTVGYIGTNTSASVETSTSVSFRNGSTALYSNTMQAYNAGHTGSWTPNMRNFNPMGDNKCGGSSNGGGVAFPDPANNATNDAFYVLIGNDLTGGACAGQGVSEYRFTGTGAAVAYNAGPTNIATSANSSEAIAAGTDGAGGYWVVTHSQASNNNFYVWHYTASGRTGPVTYTPATTAAIGVTTSGGYLKFSPCMNMIAFAGFGGAISVYNFDRTTGAIGAEIASKGSVGKVGLEFSPDGTKVFYSGQGTVVSWFLVSNPATGGTIAGSNSWSMQMGPDAQIYTSGAEGATTVGVITDPNSVSAGHSAIALTAPGSVFRGLSNISWLSPQLPSINVTNTLCNTYDFSMLFRNYFNDNVTIKTNSYSWNFGDGSPLGTGSAPSHTYPSGVNSYTVTLTFRDSCCNQLWTATTTVNTTCVVAPVNLLSFTGHAEAGGNALYWATASEVNNGYFEIMKSENGIDFYSIGTLAGQNQPSGVSNYFLLDENSSPVNYYYLVQYDTDGKSVRSNTIVITNETLQPVVSPNPSIQNFTVSMPYDPTTIVTVSDVLGRIIETKSMEGNTVVVGDNLSKGTYILIIETESNRYYHKIVKE